MPKFHTSLVYDEYVNYLKKIKFETHFETDLVNKTQIQNRLKQKFISTTLALYVKKFSDFVTVNHSSPSDDYFSDLSSLKVNSKNTVNLGLGLVFKSITEFMFEWVLFWAFIVQNRFTRNKITAKPVSLLFGLGLESILSENSDSRFVNYLNSYDKHKIDPLGQFDVLIVQSHQSLLSTNKNVFYSKYPQAFIFKKYNFTWIQYFKIIGLHVLSLFDFLKIVIFHSELLLIVRDFSCLRVFNYVSGLGLIKDVMYTISNYTAQPLWMRLSSAKYFKVHKIHYAQNTRQLVYKDYLHEAVNPCFYQVYADTVWVWTEDFKLFVSQVYNCKDIRVVGPIMFYLPNIESKNSLFNSTEFNISLFDVTPISEAFATSTGILTNYYSGVNLKKYLNDLVNTAKQIENELNIKVNLFLKHKRSFHQVHDKSYIDLCHQLEKEGKVIPVAYEENIFNFILDTDLSIAIPYTSTAHICAYYNKQSLYYDPTGEVLLQPNFNDKVVLIGSQAELYKALKEKVLIKFNV